MRLTIGATALLFVATIVVTTIATGRERDEKLQLQIMMQMDELENALAMVHHAADEGDLSTLIAQVHVARQGSETITRSLGAISTPHHEVHRGLAKAQQAMDDLARAAAIDDDSRRIAALKRESRTAIESVNSLNAVLASYYDRISARQSAVGLQIHILIAAVTLLLGILIVQQSRAVRTQQRLYSEMHALMEGTPQVLLSVDAQGTPQRWNDRLLRSAGLTARELGRGRLTDLFSADHHPQVFQALDVALTHGIWEGEIPLQCADRRLVEYAWVFSRNDSGLPDTYEITISGRDVSDRSAAQRELRKTETRYRELFEQIRDAVYSADNGVLVDVNGAASRLSGYTKEELIGSPATILYENPADRETYLAELRRQSGSISEYPLRIRRKDGVVRDCLVTALLRVSEHGETVHAIVRDVSERKRIMNELHRSESEYRGLFENALDAIILIDPVTEEVLDANPRACALYGFEPHEFLGRSMIDLSVDPGQGRDYAAQTMQGTGRYLPFESEHYRRDGTVISVEIRAAMVSYKSRPAILSINRDVTERREAERKVRELLARVQNVATEWTTTFDAVGVPIVMIDDDGLIRRANAAAYRLAGRAHDTLLHCPASALEGEPWQTIASIATLYRTQGTVEDSRAEDPVTHRIFDVASTAVDLSGEKRLIIALHELTRLKQLEESLRQTEITAALGAVVAGVAHEVRNPLFTISVTLDSWEARMGATPELRCFLDPLRQEIDWLNTLMQDLLDYGKPQELDPEPVCIVATLEAAIQHNRMLLAQANVDVVIDAPPDPDPLYADEGKLQQVFRNLIENAVQHSPSGSTVHVCVQENVDGLVVEVIDHGTGLSPTDLKCSFVPFYSRRKGGTGLGLPVARRLVTAHGGEISLRNGEGGGTIATVRLPHVVVADEKNAQAS